MAAAQSEGHRWTEFSVDAAPGTNWNREVIVPSRSPVQLIPTEAHSDRCVLTAGQNYMNARHENRELSASTALACGPPADRPSRGMRTAHPDSIWCLHHVHRALPVVGYGPDA